MSPANAQDQGGQPAAGASDAQAASPAGTEGGNKAEIPAAADTKPERASEPAAAAPAQPAASPAQSVTAPTPDTKDSVLRIGTPGGAYLKSQEQAFFTPFAKRGAYQVKATAFDGGYDALKSRAQEFDLVDIDGATAQRACNEKLIEPLDSTNLEPATGGVSAVDDFLPGAVQPCAIATVAWSAVVVYDKGMKKEPGKLADFFDVKKFPGKRLLPKGPKFTLELALLADGVAPADIYTQLATPEGQSRAFAKLASIKDHVTWFDKPTDLYTQIGEKNHVMGLAFNGRAFMAIVSERRPIGILWDRQIYAFDYWAIPVGAKNTAGAKEFIRFATAPTQLAEQARWFPYGPARKSAARLPIKHSELDMEMKPWLPTSEGNLQGALALDPAWWATNEAPLKDRFAAWLEGRETNTTTPASSPQ